MATTLNQNTKIRTVHEDITTYLKLLFHKYKLLNSPELASKFDEFGVFNGCNGTITIDNTIPDTMMFEVLIHEVCEGLNYHLELDLEHNQITGIATGMAMFMLDNRELLIRELNKLTN